jgi:hypothetical protein
MEGYDLHNPEKKNRVSLRVWLLMCIAAIYTIGLSFTVQNEVLNAVTEITNISCDNLWTCNKTVCIDGECTTTKTNSSEIKDIEVPWLPTEEESADEDIGDSDDSIDIGDLREERLDMVR